MGQAFKSIQAFGLATPHPTVAAGQNERPMAKLRQIFEMTAGADADAVVVQAKRSASMTSSKSMLWRAG